jgi:quercetin dioxygenase-like cupin family protein
MSTPTDIHRVARRVDLEQAPMLDVMGATVQYLTPLDVGQPCVLRGTIPPGVVVPLHSHADPETFLQISGQLEGFVDAADSVGWVPIAPGDIFHIPGDAKHAWRNPAPEPAVTILLTTATLGRFFRDVGTPITPGAATAWPPSIATIQRFIAIAERYGYWNATPAENAEIGLRLG